MARLQLDRARFGGSSSLAPTLGALLVLCAAPLLLSPPASAASASLDIDYASASSMSGNLNRLDIYRPDGAPRSGSRPVVVYVHGGGWRAGDKTNKIDDKVELFTGAGYVFVSVNYRLSPRNTGALAPGRIKFPVHPDDLGEAIGWLDDNVGGYGGDPERILLTGHSAGAHLVSLVSADPSYLTANGVEPWQIVGTVSLDTAGFDIAGRIAEGSGQTRSLYYNAFGTPQENAASGLWRAASPLSFAGPGDPDFLLVTQGRNGRRIRENARMAIALGQDPADIFEAPYDHAGINAAVGSPSDRSGLTGAILRFAASELSRAKPPKVKLLMHPPRTTKTKKKRARVTFRIAAGRPSDELRCRIDSRRLRPCGKIKKAKLKRGEHSFRFQAVSDRGRPGKVRSFEFEVKRQQRRRGRA